MDEYQGTSMFPCFLSLFFFGFNDRRLFSPFAPDPFLPYHYYLPQSLFPLPLLFTYAPCDNEEKLMKRLS